MAHTVHSTLVPLIHGAVTLTLPDHKRLALAAPSSSNATLGFGSYTSRKNIFCSFELPYYKPCDFKRIPIVVKTNFQGCGRCVAEVEGRGADGLSRLYRHS